MTKKDANKDKRFRVIIIICLLLIPALTFFETRVLLIDEISFPISGNVLVFVLININVLLLLLMVFLVLRRLVELVFERRKQILGTKLRTKLVISFVSLSLIPTALLFFIALQFISTSMDYWFNSTVDQSLQESLNIAKNIYQKARDHVKNQTENISTQLVLGNYDDSNTAAIDTFFNYTLTSQNLESLELISDQRKSIVTVVGEKIRKDSLPDIPAELIRTALENDKHQTTIQPIPEGELVRGIKQISLGPPGTQNTLLLATSTLISKKELNRLEIISKGLEGYRQLMILKNPIKTSLIVMLMIVTLLIVFCAIWFGFYVAQGLTGPIGKLADATRRVADGELDFVLEKDSDDEMGLLVDSFNKMTRDLLNSNRELERAYLALKDSNIELDERRRYIEIILQNVPAGVISFDENKQITTINRFAEELLQIDKENFIHKDYRETLIPYHLQILENLLDELAESGQSSLQRPLQLTVRNETFSLLVNYTKLEDEQYNPIGGVLVFDNLTQLEKAQRAAAWREVAKRIAHEVKNPLTPIQLSAQRLRKRYLDLLGKQGDVFDLCTNTIINQVDELKRLVSEFSAFARMPAVQKTMSDLEDMVNEVLVLYSEAHKNIHFIISIPQEVPIFNFDRKQLKRVLINLLDNAVAVLPDGGTIEIGLKLNADKNRVFIEIMDDGPGVSDNDKFHLFEPYFSTKKSGTGLGLTIASTIVADHDGYIRVLDNKPTGAVFIIELPLQI